MKGYVKLVSISMAIASISGYVFNFADFNSKDSLIKQGIDKMKNVITAARNDLADLQSQYNDLLNNLTSKEDALAIAKTN